MKKAFLAIVKYFKQTDNFMLLFSIAASLFGLVLVYSTSQYRVTSSGKNSLMLTQIVATVLGLICMFVLSKIDYHSILDWWKIIAGVSIFILVLVLFIGTGPSGSEDKSWIIIGKLSVQPAEFIKFAFVLTFSKHFDMVKDDIKSIKSVLLLALHGIIPVGLIVLTKDMGMALVFVVILITMLFASGIQLRYFAGLGIAVLAAFPIIWNIVFGTTQRGRILALFDPLNSDYERYIFHQNQAITALASGELWGYGFLNGPRTQSKTEAALFARQNDMIFASCGEEFGFIGCLAVIVILSVILIRIIIDSTHSKDVMGSMICIGVFSSFAVQIIINLGMALRLLPVVGLTLPFFSSGGSAVLSSFIGLGLVLSVYMHRKDLMFAEQSNI